jgi:anti-anti-sigma factor
LHPGLRIGIDRGAEETVLVIAGELDLSTTDQLADTVRSELRNPPTRLVLDLAGMTFCDSIGLGTLIVLSRAARNQNTFLQLRNPDESFLRTVEITGVGAGLNIAE